MEEKLSRREVREGAFIILYQTLFGQTPQEITEADEEAFGLARSHETDLIVNGVLSHDEEITGIIAKYSTTRSVARISKVNLIIMKIAIYEIKYDDRCLEPPPSTRRSSLARSTRTSRTATL